MGVPSSAVRILTVVAAAAILDTLTLGAPLASVWRYVDYNIFAGVSTTFGTEPWNYYLTGEAGLWRGATAVLIVLVLIGARRFPALLGYALIIVATHSLIAHKEYRFIYPALVLFAVLVGTGTAECVVWGRERLRAWGVSLRLALTLLEGFAIASWAVLAVGLWTGPVLTPLRYRAHDSLEAAAFVRQEPQLCGIGLYGGGGTDWVDSGGYTYFHRSVPLYWPKDITEFTASVAGFDTLVFILKLAATGIGFCDPAMLWIRLRCAKAGPLCRCSDDGDAFSRTGCIIGACDAQ